MYAVGPVNWFQALVILIVTLLGLLFLPSTITTSITSSNAPVIPGTAPGPAVTAWQFIVPNGYIGDLAIAFGCPRGHPLNRRQGAVTTRFSATGIDCVRDPAPSKIVLGRLHAIRANGALIPTYRFGDPAVTGQTVFTSTGSGEVTIPNNRTIQFLGYYVGPSDCAKDLPPFDPNAHMPARCHYEFILAFVGKHFGS